MAQPRTSTPPQPQTDISRCLRPTDLRRRRGCFRCRIWSGVRFRWRNATRGSPQLRLQLNQQIDARAGGLPNTIARQSVRPGSRRPDRSGRHRLRGLRCRRCLASFNSKPTRPRTRIAAVGLNPRRSEETSDLTPGTVLRQVPEAGVLVALGASVGITVAVPRRVVIPNVVGTHARRCDTGTGATEASRQPRG